MAVIPNSSGQPREPVADDAVVWLRRDAPRDVECIRCGAAESVNYGSRRSCRRCGANWQAA